jgi:hypothetical protein
VGHLASHAAFKREHQLPEAMLVDGHLFFMVRNFHAHPDRRAAEFRLVEISESGFEKQRHCGSF